MARLDRAARGCGWRSSAASASRCSLSVALVPLGLVGVKMLPFDNKSEFQVIINMPEGTPLEQTARVASALAQETLRQPSVTNVQTYVGTSSPYNFNGLVRHYFMRRLPHQADLQVNLVPKEERSEQSHAIAKQVRELLLPVARKYGARDPGGGGAARARRCSRRWWPRSTGRTRPGAWRSPPR